ncbi:single-stranded-DNA-specific exonuclease RecJ [Acetitomaculum ruminis]|uniref:single-stranded-DNA-specific exonuclease RecJ n=1 Tax=Acetitomaculum ruminis TaxID=2382 RepID=UPI000B804688
MKKWFITNKYADFYANGKKFNIDPVVARVIRNRDVYDDEIEEYLSMNISFLNNPRDLKDLDKATDIILGKIDEGKKIRVIGDYDIDGVCSTYILQDGIKQVGGIVDYDIPDRVKDGYGINESLIQKAFDEGIDTIITCDNGIAAREQIKYGKELGMTIVVTDHHDVPYEEIAGEKIEKIPEADAVVDAKQLDCPYPFKELCGASIALKFVTILLEKKGIKDWQKYDYLEMAAIATIGDVVELKKENRLIAKLGMDKIKSTINIGLKALIEVTGLSKENISSYHIGFVIGPCLNAGGRLYTAKLALKLFMCHDYEEALKIALELKNLNDRRKEMTEKGVMQAVSIIEEHKYYNDKVIIAYLPDCHESIIGIVAGRIREKYYRPTFILSKGEDAVKGSGRSIESFHMFDEMIKCQDIFEKFGGHAMAAGLSIKEENIEEFRRQMNDNCQLGEADFVEKLQIDVPMPLDYITEKLINDLSVIEPFGKGNTKPVFARKDISVLNLRIMGKNRNVIKMQVREDKYIFDAIYFGNVEKMMTYLKDKFGQYEIEENLMKRRSDKVKLSMAYYPSVNEYMGRKSLQIIVSDYF